MFFEPTTLADPVQSIPLAIVRGVPWAPPPLSYIANPAWGGPWVAGRAYAAGAVITPFPYPDPVLEPLYLLAENGGTSGAVPPAWPTAYGNTVVDNPGGSQIVWLAQPALSYVADLTGYTLELDFLNEPDDPAPPTLSLSTGSGLTISGTPGLLYPALTVPQIEALLATADHGFYRVVGTPPSGPAQRLFEGRWDIHY